MLDKILKALLPITIIITLVQTFLPTGPLSFLDPLNMIITCLLIYSIGWWLSSFVYREGQSDYLVSRHVGLAALFAIPIVAIIFVPSFLYPYIVGKAFTFRFLAIVALASLAYLSFTNENYRPKVTPFMAGFTLFALVMALATVFSMDSSRSFWSNYERMEGYINLLSLFVLAMTATSFRLHELEWNRIFNIHIWVSSIVSGLGVLQYFVGVLGMKNLSGLPILNLCVNQANAAACRVDSTLGNSIYLGIYAALTFWLIIFAIFGKKVKGNLLPILAGVNILAVYFSGTRGVWLGMFLGLIVLIVSKYWFDGNKKAVAGTILSGVLAVALFAGFIVYAKKNNIAQDVPVVARFSSVNTLFARWNIWQTAVTSWEEKPILGWGQENFIHAFNKNYNPAMYGQETYFDHPHNTYLGWLVFGGILGFLSFLFMLFTSVFGIIKSNLKEEKENDLVIPILFALLTTYFVHIFFVFDNLTSSLLFILISVYFGSQYSYGALNLPQVHHKKYLGILVACLGIYFVYDSIYLPSYANLTTIQAMTYQQMSRSTNPVDVLKGTQNLYEKAINMNTFGTYEIREFYLQKSLEYANLIPQVSDENVKNAITSVANSALLNFQKQVEQNPFDHRAMFMLGLYFLNIKNYDKAVEVLTQALEKAPNKQIAIIYLAKAHLLKGDMANASIYYERAMSITPKNIPGYNQIRIEYIQLLMLSNQDEKALAVIKDLIPTASRDDFNTLVSQITQVYTQRKDLAGIVKLLKDANTIDPTNQNFVLWLAQAYVAVGDYNNAAFTINKLSTSNPEVVAQFNQQLNAYVDEMNKKQQSQATTTPVKKK